MFLVSAVDLAILFLFVLLGQIPGVTYFLNHSPMKMLFVAVIGSLIILGMPSMLILFFGMATYCVLREGSPHFTKFGWFVLFLLTGPIGSMIYFFTVYPKHGRLAVLTQ
jgi:hypothetical protein